jgi:signal transduction histidine kinase
VRGTEQRGEGLGLGLSLVQRICENQGWTVSLDTMEPNGCRFSVEMGKRPGKDPARLSPTNVSSV